MSMFKNISCLFEYLLYSLNFVILLRIDICDSALPIVRKEIQFLLVHTQTIRVLNSVLNVQSIDFCVAEVSRLNVHHVPLAFS